MQSCSGQAAVGWWWLSEGFTAIRAMLEHPPIAFVQWDGSVMYVDADLDGMQLSGCEAAALAPPDTSAAAAVATDSTAMQLWQEDANG